ncbi:MAG: hypothetical protein GYA15_14790 [Leptolinea sp.]|jgi:Tol biopolymer transport system component|nr:hypothetical protein [Leptolinea sp.]
MKSRIIYSRILYLIFGLVVLICLGLVFLPLWQTLPEPRISPEKGAEISSLAEIKLTFPVEMDRDSVESHLSIQPPVNIQSVWDGNRLTIITESGYPTDMNIQILLSAGATSRNDHRYPKDLAWQFHIRPAEIAYLGKATNTPEIWLVNQRGDNSRQITHTSGRITGFAAEPNGSGFYYSVRNDLGGADIHHTDRDGGHNSLIVNCEHETCGDPAVSRDGRLLAFSRNRDPLDGTTSTADYIYTLLTTEDNPIPAALIQEKGITGSLPSFSPDGLKLAFYDKNSRGIRVQYPEGRHDFLLGTGRPQKGAWSPDGTRLAFVEDIFEDEVVSSTLYVVDLVSGTITEPFKDILPQIELGEPDWSPNGRKIILGARLSGGPIGRQLWLLDLEGLEATPLTGDLSRMQAAPKWSPDGQWIVFQQSRPGVTGSKPEAVVWNSKNHSTAVVAEDAAMPAWAP